MLTIFAALMLAPTAAEAPADKAKDPVICTRRENHTVGTRLGKKTCMTKSQWEYVEKQTQKEMQQLRDLHLSPGQKGVERGGVPQ